MTTTRTSDVGFLLDTMAVSELGHPRANPGLRQWEHENAQAAMYVAAPTIGELESGIRRLPQSNRRYELEAWLERVVKRFAARVVPYDLDAARVWGRADATARMRGTTLSIFDAQIAAIAVTHDLTVVTRNVKHFIASYFPGLRITNPWT